MLKLQKLYIYVEKNINEQELVQRQRRRTVLYSAQKLLRPEFRNPTLLAGEEIPVKHTVSIVWSP